jgi:TonB-linked SusC/RagA family outer membrane protein
MNLTAFCNEVSLRKLITKTNLAIYKLRKNRQIFLSMRLTAFILIAAINLHATGFSQISISEKNAPLEKVFKAIEKQTGYVFFYDLVLLQQAKTVSIKVKNAQLDEVLTNCFKDQPLTYSIVGKTVVVKQKEELIINNPIPVEKLLNQNIAITGNITDEATGKPLAGATVKLKTANTSTTTDENGNFTIEVPAIGNVLLISYVGYETMEVRISKAGPLKLTLKQKESVADEVIVVGLGRSKKINVTGAVSVVGKKDLANRPVSSAMQALQGVSPGLVITTTGDAGQPGGKMNINIRGLTSLEGSSNPFVLIDGIPMSITDIDPEDIESISILKDAASSAIYGGRAAFGVILITTKKGKNREAISMTYSNNFASNEMLNMPRKADAVSFAHLINQSQINLTGSPFYTAERFANIVQNAKNPGSAPEMYRSGQTWQMGNWGINNTAANDWMSIFLKDRTYRIKHNLSFSGGTEKLNYYISGGLYDEQGFIKPSDDHFKRYNVSATVNSKISDWLSMSLVTKYRYSNTVYPTSAYEESGSERSFILEWMQRVKPTTAMYFPGTKVYIGDNRMYNYMNNKVNMTERQLVMAPRLIIEPIKGWVTTAEFNYTTNDNNNNYQSFGFPTARPKVDGSYNSDIIQSEWQGDYMLKLFTNTYLSPNVYSKYTKSIAKHNFSIMAGYQQETFRYTNLRGDGITLLSPNIPAITTAVGNSTVSDMQGNWSTQGVFGRFSYNYDEKYLLEVNSRYDGTSKFAPDNRWGYFPSVSGGWVASKEKFFPLKDVIDVFKLRASYGTIGNQNVNSYLYLPGMPVSQSSYLFTDLSSRPWQVGMPDMASVNLGWETVTTKDLGFDAQLLKNRLNITFDWYNSVTSNLVSPGPQLPSVLGSTMPKKNDGEVSTKGWELEVSWKSTKKSDFSYGAKLVLSNYKSIVSKFNNPSKLIQGYYEGMNLGEIWGMQTAGLFQTQQEIDKWANQFQVSEASYPFKPGDVKYVDQNGDGIINTGLNTLDAPGDRKIIGNSTPRFQFGISGYAEWKGFDMSFLIQGIARREVYTGQLGTFRGAANGAFHTTIYEGHMDYWRDASSPLGANPNGYFPNSYLAFDNQNQKNFRFPTDRYLQNAAYIRLKNLQIGYTMPRKISEKVLISKARIYLSGENLLTGSKLMFFDPEAFQGNTSRVGSQYPLSRIFSIGLNINF